MLNSRNIPVACHYILESPIRITCQHDHCRMSKLQHFRVALVKGHSFPPRRGGGGGGGGGGGAGGRGGGGVTKTS